MDEPPRSYQLDSTPRQVSLRLLAWWFAAIAFTALVLWLFVHRGRAGVLTTTTLLEFAALIIFWLFAVGTRKLTITKGQVWRVDLYPDHLLFLRYYDKKHWRADYRDIVEVSVHFADASCSYDRMELGLAKADGDMGFTGACRCPGERMEELAAEIRRRAGDAGGGLPGSAAEDRLIRVDMAATERRRVKIAILFCLPFALVPPLLVEYYARQERALLQNGAVTVGVVTSTSPGHNETLISYEYGGEWGQRLHGIGAFPENAVQPGGLHAGSILEVQYNPDNPEVSRLMAAPPRPYMLFRAISFLPLLVFVIALYLAFKGRTFACARGKVYLLRAGELDEDRIKRSNAEPSTVQNV